LTDAVQTKGVPDFLGKYKKQIVILDAVDGRDYCDVANAARLLGVTGGVMRNYVWQGRVTTYKFYTHTYIRMSELTGQHKKA
jgi:hypothetical protein